MIVIKDNVLYIIERERERERKREEGDYISWRRKHIEWSLDFKKVMRKEEPSFSLI